jgi:quercetin 2,3-dioxygenase
MTKLHIFPATSRGLTQTNWLTSHHSFSFGDYHDPARMGVGMLRVINDDWVAAGAGFPRHPHKNMEIITYVLQGALTHKDSLDNGTIIKAGDIQRMSAGTGITHSEYNASTTESVHFLQIWIMPDRQDYAPSYAQKTIPSHHGENDFAILAGPTETTHGITLSQDAVIRRRRLKVGDMAHFYPTDGRMLYIHVVQGTVLVGDTPLITGDGAATEDVTTVTFTAAEDSEILLFDLAGR